VVAVRQRYRQAKLALEDAKRSPHAGHRQRELVAVIQECDDLIAKATMQQLAEKGLRLKATALEELGHHQAAAESFETAARKFAEHRSNWYVCDCL
jgi:hypothetical protein